MPVERRKRQGSPAAAPRLALFFRIMELTLLCVVAARREAEIPVPFKGKPMPRCVMRRDFKPFKNKGDDCEKVAKK